MIESRTRVKQQSRVVGTPPSSTAGSKQVRVSKTSSLAFDAAHEDQVPQVALACQKPVAVVHIFSPSSKVMLAFSTYWYSKGKRCETGAQGKKTTTKHELNNRKLHDELGTTNAQFVITERR